MNEKLCATCKQPKPYSPEYKRNTKASGFYGKHCWTCHQQWYAEWYKQWTANNLEHWNSTKD